MMSGWYVLLLSYFMSFSAETMLPGSFLVGWGGVG